ncbi:MAG: hypothetical protein QGD94_03545, partial [Planctomycetia bacterium]|nr:hypothetical protein [Planctomycetia bacterium]
GGYHRRPRMPDYKPNPAVRAFAVLALVAALVLVIVVVATSVGGSGGGDDGNSQPADVSKAGRQAEDMLDPQPRKRSGNSHSIAVFPDGRVLEPFGNDSSFIAWARGAVNVRPLGNEKVHRQIVKADGNLLPVGLHRETIPIVGQFTGFAGHVLLR